MNNVTPVHSGIVLAPNGHPVEMTKRLDASAIKKGMDAWVNAMTGAGYSSDKSTFLRFQSASDLDEATLEALYTDSDLAATIVERKVHDALRGGYELDWQGATDQERREVVDWAENEYELTTVVRDARIYSRLFGGGAVQLGIAGEPESEAMAGDDVAFLRAVSSVDLEGERWFGDPKKQNFGEVAYYRLRLPQFHPTASNGSEAYVNLNVHHSRFVPFYGVLTTATQQWRDKGWGKSVLHRVYEVLKKFDSSFDAILHTLSEQSFLVYKVENLLSLLASENADLLAQRFELINTGKGAYRAIVMDAVESVERVEANLSQASSVVDKAMLRVSGAAQTPSTILWGMQPAGQNATGASDLENWNQQVASEQSLVLGPGIAKLYRFLLAQRSSPLRSAPEDLKVNFPAVETPSIQEQVNLYAQTMGADAAAVEKGILTPEEVAIARAQHPGMFPKVDISLRRELQALREERLLHPPDPMEMAAAEGGEENQGGDEEPDDDDTGTP